MADEFEVEQATEGVIRIRHAQEGHRYSFYISFDEHGRRRFTAGQVRADERAKRSAAAFEIAAFRCAKREARRLGLLDESKPRLDEGKAPDHPSA